MARGSVRTNRGRPYKPSTVRKYEEQLRCLVLPRIGAVPIVALTRGDVQRLVDEIAAEHTAEHGRKALTALRVALRLAEAYGELDANPCAGVRVPSDGKDERAARILTPEEAEELLAACYADDERLGRSFAGPLYTLALGAGLRMGELLALPWGPDGLDLESGVVRVRRSLDRVRDAGGAYPFVPPKFGRHREVPLAPEDVARLRRHRLATGRRDGELVFADEEGQPLSPVPAFRAFKRACRAVVVARASRALERAQAAGEARAICEAEQALERAAHGRSGPLPRPHDCRHAFATHLLAAGLGTHAVAELLGHRDEGLVRRRYGHALPDEVARAGEALSAFRHARQTSGLEHGLPHGGQAAGKALEIEG